MKHFERKNTHDLYADLFKHVLNNGLDIAPRGLRCVETLSISAKLTDIYSDVINFNDSANFNVLAYPNRQKDYLEYKENEIEWYKSGSTSCKDAPGKKWSKIADPNGNIQSNYGYLILHENLEYTNEDCSSYKNAICLLKHDIYTRQAILHYNLPKHYNTRSTDIPCTVCAQIFIRNNKLSMIVYQRSSDLYYGFPYDIPWHCWLIKKIVADLKDTYKDLECGDLEIIFGSLHIYEDKLDFFMNEGKK